jgi:hypothetical protein
MGASDGSRPGTYTCAYFYRLDGGTRWEAPAYCDCHSGDAMPRSAVTVMLKCLAHAKLP